MGVLPNLRSLGARPLQEVDLSRLPAKTTEERCYACVGGHLVNAPSLEKVPLPLWDLSAPVHEGLGVLQRDAGEQRPHSPHSLWPMRYKLRRQMVRFYWVGQSTHERILTLPFAEHRERGLKALEFLLTHDVVRAVRCMPSGATGVTA